MLMIVKYAMNHIMQIPIIMESTIMMFMDYVSNVFTYGR